MLPKPHTFPASETIAENYRKISQTFYTSVQNVPSDFLKLDLDRGQREGDKAQGEQIKAKDIEKILKTCNKADQLPPRWTPKVP